MSTSDAEFKFPKLAFVLVVPAGHLRVASDNPATTASRTFENHLSERLREATQ